MIVNKIFKIIKILGILKKNLALFDSSNEFIYDQLTFSFKLKIYFEYNIF